MLRPPTDSRRKGSPPFQSSAEASRPYHTYIVGPRPFTAPTPPVVDLHLLARGTGLGGATLFRVVRAPHGEVGPAQDIPHVAPAPLRRVSQGLGGRQKRRVFWFFGRNHYVCILIRLRTKTIKRLSGVWG